MQNVIQNIGDSLWYMYEKTVLRLPSTLILKGNRYLARSNKWMNDDIYGSINIISVCSLPQLSKQF